MLKSRVKKVREDKVLTAKKLLEDLQDKVLTAKKLLENLQELLNHRCPEFIKTAGEFPDNGPIDRTIENLKKAINLLTVACVYSPSSDYGDAGSS